MQRIQFEGYTCIVSTPEDIEQLEQELNETKKEIENINRANNILKGALIDANNELQQSLTQWKQVAERLAEESLNNHKADYRENFPSQALSAYNELLKQEQEKK